MRIGPKDELWVVVDPKQGADKLNNILTKTTLNGLTKMFWNGKHRNSNFTMYAFEGSARRDARIRIRLYKENTE